MGRHPFAGRHLGAGEPPTIEVAIEQSRYAYGRDQLRTRLAPPPGSLPIGALTSTIQDLFEQAFAPSGVRSGRPSGERWAGALTDLVKTLRQCSTNQFHHYFSGLLRCPWCEIEAASGTPLFPVVFIQDRSTSSGIDALWNDVTKVPPPGLLRPLPDPQQIVCGPSTEARLLGQRRARELVILVGAAIVSTAAAIALLSAAPQAAPIALVGVLAVAVVGRRRSHQTKGIRDTLSGLRAEWDRLKSDWATTPPAPTYADVWQNLRDLKARHDNLPTERATRLQALWEGRRLQQQAEHLDRCHLAVAKIPGVGAAKVATLQAHGVDTARDVAEARILAIPGFGPVTARGLMQWRRDCERRFRFDPQKGVSHSEIAVLERDIAMRRQTIEHDITSGLARLKVIARATEARNSALQSKANDLATRLAQANADAKVMGLI